jgi:hypothetical protein
MAGDCIFGYELCDASSVWAALGHCKSTYHLTYIVALMLTSLEESGCYTSHYYS